MSQRFASEPGAGRAQPPPSARAAVWIVAGLALATYAGLQPLRAPEPLATDAPASDFSAGRALRHVQQIARAPHPVGLPEHARVRDYLVAELRRLGLEVEVQRATSLNPAFGAKWKGPVPAAAVENVVARLRGTAGTRPLLLAAHYDSVPWAPGAADDGAGVATLLETLRALRQGPPLRNDLIVLLSDAEEQGLLGARAFVEQHPLGRAGGLALNFEARGHAGPSMMFETSAGNGRLIEAFAATPRPIGNSLAYEIYRLLPNDTDFTVLRQAGWAGLNFAFIHGVTHYHTRLDAPEALDPGSLQHHGSYALALARRFGHSDLGRIEAPDRVYFNTIVPQLVSYSHRLAVALTLAVVAALAALLFYGVRRGRLSLRGVFGGVVAFALLPPALAVPGGVLWWLLGRLHATREAMVLGDPYESWRYALGFVLLGAAFFAFVVTRLRRRLALDDLWAGTLVGWAALALLTTFLMPGASYVFTWPLAFALGGLAVRLTAGPDAAWAKAAWAASGLPGVLLLAPIVHLVFVALTLALLPAALLLLAILLTLLLPHFDLLTARRERLLPGLAALAGGLLLLSATLTDRFDAGRPRPDNLFYVFDSDAGNATWGSTDRRVDDWTRQALGDAPRHGRFDEYLPTAPENSPLLPETLLMQDAPRVELAPPEVQLLEETRTDGGRRLRLRVRSPRGAPVLSVHADAAAAIEEAQVDGRAAGARRPWALCYWSAPAQGIELRLRLRGTQPLKLKVLDLSYGLPGSLMPPRPRWSLPTYFLGFVQDATIGVRTFVL